MPGWEVQFYFGRSGEPGKVFSRGVTWTWILERSCWEAEKGLQD